METKDEACLICKKPLKYLKESIEMTCVICGKKVMSKTCCVDGHFVCDDCHDKGVELIKPICLSSTSRDPYQIALDLMHHDFIHLHGPEHHVLVGSALLTAYKNAGGRIDLERALTEMAIRGKEVPGGACGFWGSCGAAISSGIFISIITGSTPLAKEAWSLSNLMTAKSLTRIGTVGGPRCCKRNSFLSLLAAVDFVKEHFDIQMEIKNPIRCGFSKRNAQCMGTECPFNAKSSFPYAQRFPADK